MKELRAISTRAKITPTSFVNEYHWGDFKGDEYDFLTRYFDAFVYVANWGTHRFMLRLPKVLIDTREVLSYCGSHYFSARAGGDSLILDFRSETEEYEDWEETGELMASLAPLRAELLRGDRRSLYLGWLLRAQEEELGEGEVEPPVPDGLNSLSAPLARLADFLRIDQDLLAITAERSSTESDANAGLAEWIAALPVKEKNQLLLDVVQGQDAHIGAQLLVRFQSSRKAKEEAQSERQRHTVGELLDAAAHHRTERKREEARRAAAARARKEAVQARARAEYLDRLAPREDAVWKEVERLVATRLPKAYDEATALLVDLRDMAERANVSTQFMSRLANIIGRYSNRPGLLKRLKRVGLAGDK
ncbi:MAG: hypothetical protein WCF57_09805 [Pyrinomonadaceae bacterium]